MTDADDMMVVRFDQPGTFAAMHAAEGLEVVDGDGIIKGNEDIACELGDAKPDLKADTSPVYPKPSDLRGEYP